MGILSSVVFARLMGPDEYGRYSFAIETMTFISIPVALGLPQLLTREVSKYSANKEYGYLKGLLRWSGLFSFLAAVVFIVLTAIVASIAENDPYKRFLFLLALPIIALRGMGQVRMGALRGFKEPIKAQMPDAVIRPGLTVLSIVALYFVFKIEINAKVAVISMDVALFLGFILGQFWLYKAVPRRDKETQGHQYENRYWLKEAVPFFFLGSIAIVNSKLSMILSGLYLPPAEVGFFKIALTASTLVSFFLTAVNTTISPLISEMYFNKQYVKLQKLLRVSVKVIFLASLTVSLIYVFFGKVLIEFLYGKEYLPAYFPLLILTVSQLVSSSAGPVGTVLSMTGFQTDPLKVNIGAVIVNILLCLILIPKIGIIGAALSTAISLVIRNLFGLLYLRKRTNLKTSIITL